MSTQQAVPSQGRANLALATLFLGMFVLGSAELLVVGVLDLIAADLQVSIPAAGTLVTAYALGLAIGGPILAALTIRLDKRIVLIGALVLFIAGQPGRGADRRLRRVPRGAHPHRRVPGPVHRRRVRRGHARSSRRSARAGRSR